eukprot:gene8344-17191_t
MFQQENSANLHNQLTKYKILGNHMISNSLNSLRSSLEMSNDLKTKSKKKNVITLFDLIKDQPLRSKSANKLPIVPAIKASSRIPIEEKLVKYIVKKKKKKKISTLKKMLLTERIERYQKSLEIKIEEQSDAKINSQSNNISNYMTNIISVQNFITPDELEDEEEKEEVLLNAAQLMEPFHCIHRPYIHNENSCEIYIECPDIPTAIAAVNTLNGMIIGGTALVVSHIHKQDDNSYNSSNTSDLKDSNEIKTTSVPMLNESSSSINTTSNTTSLYIVCLKNVIFPDDIEDPEETQEVLSDLTVLCTNNNIKSSSNMMTLNNQISCVWIEHLSSNIPHTNSSTISITSKSHPSTNTVVNIDIDNNTHHHQHCFPDTDTATDKDMLLNPDIGITTWEEVMQSCTSTICPCVVMMWDSLSDAITAAKKLSKTISASASVSVTQTVSASVTSRSASKQQQSPSPSPSQHDNNQSVTTIRLLCLHYTVDNQTLCYISYDNTSDDTEQIPSSSSKPIDKEEDEKTTTTDKNKKARDGLEYFYFVIIGGVFLGTETESNWSTNKLFEYEQELKLKLNLLGKLGILHPIFNVNTHDGDDDVSDTSPPAVSSIGLETDKTSRTTNEKVVMEGGSGGGGGGAGMCPMLVVIMRHKQDWKEKLFDHLYELCFTSFNNDMATDIDTTITIDTEKRTAGQSNSTLSSPSPLSCLPYTLIGCVGFSDRISAVMSALRLNDTVVGGGRVTAWVRTRTVLEATTATKPLDNAEIHKNSHNNSSNSSTSGVNAYGAGNKGLSLSLTSLSSTTISISQNAQSNDIHQVVSLPSNSSANNNVSMSVARNTSGTCPTSTTNTTSSSTNTYIPVSTSTPLTTVQSQSTTTVTSKFSSDVMKTIPKLPKRDKLPLPTPPPLHLMNIADNDTNTNMTKSDMNMTMTDMTLAVAVAVAIPLPAIPKAEVHIEVVIMKMLHDLNEFQQRAIEKNPINAKLKQRFVLGIKQSINGVKADKAKVVFLAPDTEASGALDTKLVTLIQEAQNRRIPILYCLTRRKLGKAVASTMKQSAVTVYDCDGVYDKYREIVTSIGATCVTKNEY